MLINDHISASNSGKGKKGDAVDCKRASLSASSPTIIDAAEFLRSPLSVHAKLFEKHRIFELTKFLKQMLRNQIAFHAKSIESYSQLLECLSEVEEIESSSRSK
jgi:hypothetical protein